MSVLMYVVGGVVLLIAGLAVLVATRPADFRIARSMRVAAPPPKVFPLVNDFHEWDHWSPWAKLDPNAAYKFDGPASGQGAKFSWVGNREVGEGSMTITESRPHDLIAIRLDFLKPFQATNTAEFTFQPRGNETEVTWSMFGKNSFMGKAFAMIVDCDKMMGSKFEEGLTAMKATAEARA